jgi:malonate decarboxylase beta subunit
LEQEHQLLSERVQRYGNCKDGRDIWRKMGLPEPEAIAMMDNDEFLAAAQGRRAKQNSGAR